MGLAWLEIVLNWVFARLASAVHVLSTQIACCHSQSSKHLIDVNFFICDVVIGNPILSLIRDCGVRDCLD